MARRKAQSKKSSSWKTLNFETLESRITPVAPLIASNGLLPLDNSVNFALSDLLHVQFDRPIKFGSSGTVTIFELGDTSAQDAIAEVFDVTSDKGIGDGLLSISGNKLTIDPTDGLLKTSTQYFVQIQPGAIEAAERTIVKETFDTATPPGLPSGWTQTDAFNNPPSITGGNAEWDGWVVADGGKWENSVAPTSTGGASNFDRPLFTRKSGNIAVADTQLWSNIGDPTTLAGTVDAGMKTPAISLNGVSVGAGQLTLDFDSSYRPSSNSSVATLQVSYDGGATFDPTPIFTRNVQNQPNEHVTLTLDNPGTGDLAFRFKIEDTISAPFFQAEARWWAIDNIIISGKLDPNGSGDGDDFAGILDRSTFNFGTVGLDLIAPTVVSVIPVDNSGGTTTEVPVDTNLQVTFSENVVAGTGHVIVRRLIDNEIVQSVNARSSAVTITDNVVTIDLPNDLADSTEYYVEIQPGAFRDASRLIQTPLFLEDFESLPLRPFITETDLDGDGKDWTNAPPAGWTIDNTNVMGTDNRNNKTGTNIGVPGLGTTDIGAPEWQGWAFTDKNEWAVTVGDQGRTGFGRGDGIIAVADPDEWDDIGSPESLGSYNTLLATPIVPLNKLINDPVLSFDSSYRNEADTDVFVEVTYYDNTNTIIGTPVQILYWSWNSALPEFKPDALSELVTLPLSLPTGAEGASFNFIMRNARNDWWWAIDNVRVDGEYLAGNPVSIVGNTTWNFKTFDKTAPVVRLLSPADDGGDVPDSAQLEISFDDNVVLGNGTISIRRLSDNSIVESFDVATSGRLTVTPNQPGGNSVIISPTNPLPLVTNLYVLITPGAIENIAGIDFAGIDKATDWNFATAGLDTVKPTILNLSPSDNAFNVPVNSNLVMTFSENVLAGSGSILIRELSSGSIVSGISATDPSVTIVGNKVTVNPPTDLQPGTDYYVEITAGAFRDEAANFFDGISGTSIWNFLTGTPLVGINSFIPADNSTNVALDSNLTINFAVPVIKGKGSVVIRRLADGSEVERIDVSSAQVTVLGSSATIDPTNDLGAATSYYVEADPGSFIGINPTATPAIVFFENFEGLTLFPFQSPTEGGGDGTDWTNITKAQTEGKLASWAMDPGTTPVGNPIEFYGWTFMDVDSWNATEGNQGRSQFVLGGIGNRGTIAVADSDAYDDGTNVDTGLFEAGLSTIVSLANIEANTASVIFDSSWQAEPTQRGKIEVSFDGGPNILIVDFAGDANDPLFKPTAFNETLEFALNNPANAKEMKVTFTYYQASNDWWWAIDNVRVRANTFESAFGGISGNEIWNFRTTGADITAPSVIALDPADGTVNVPVAQNLVISFDEPIQFGTSGKITVFRAIDNVAVAVFDVASPVGLTPSGNKMTINPPADLAPLTGYYVTIDATAIRDLAGNNFAGISDPTTWNFTTASLTPVITALSPADDSVGADIQNLVLNITFDRIIRRGVGNVNLRLSSDNSIVANIEVRSAQVNIVNETAQVSIPSSLTLQELTSYYIEIDSGAFEDVNGVDFPGISGPTTWNFTTRENVVPTLVSLNPTDNAENVPADSNLILTFSENIFAGGGTIQIVSPINDAVIETFDVLTSSRLTFNGNVVTIDPTSNLAAGQTYFVRVQNGAIVDLFGNKYAGILNRAGYNFRTISENPLIASFAPNDDGLNVPLNSNLSVTFSEAIKFGTSGTVVITDAAGNTFATYDITTSPPELTINGSTLTINPATDLAATTGYFITISPGAILDLADNPFAGITYQQTWNFYTGVADTQAPAVTTLTPPDNGTGVTSADPLTITFDETIQKGSGFITVFRSSDNAVITKIDVTSSQVTVNGKTATIDTAGVLPQDGGTYYVSASPGSFIDTAAATGLTLFAEDFEGLIQYPFVSQAANAKYDGSDFTDVPPTGWVRDIGPTTPTGGSPTYFGWTFLDIDSWIAEAGQNRSDFILGGVGKRGTVAVADGDQYQDSVSTPNNSINIFLSTPSINLAGVTEDTVVLSFDSSFRPEATQEGIVEVSYDGGQSFSKVFSRLAEDQRNEKVSIALDTPAGATSLIVRFGYINADNNWWWAIDNVRVAGDVTGANAFAGISDPTAWNFTTVDTIAPTVVSLTPADDSINVLPSTDLTVEFDDTIQFSTGTITIFRVSDNSVFATYTAGVSSELSITGSTLTINPAADLESQTDYYIEISPTAISDTDGNPFAGIAGPGTWNFSTLDVAGPVLTASTPADDAIAVAVDANLTLTFDEPIQRGSGNIVLRRLSDNSIVETFDAATSDRISIAGNLLTIDPTSDLADGTEYYVEIDPGAIRDLSINLGSTLSLFTEGFENLTLFPFFSPTESGGDGTDWTNLTKAQAEGKLAGWDLDTTTTPSTGVPEFFGWTFLDIDSWQATAGQSRSSFILGGAGSNGTVAVADGDEYDDAAGSTVNGDINVFLSTPSIDISTAAPNSTVLTFDSSFRAEGAQAGIVEVTFDGGANWSEVFRRDVTTNLNESVTINLANPMGATTLMARFGYINADNNWWWAIDNIGVAALLPGNPYGGISGPATFNFSTNDAPVVDDQTLSVDENSSLDTVIGTVAATDAEGAVTFAIISGNTDGAFTIDSTGKVTVANPAALDFETTSTYSLTIEVTDAGAPTLTDTAVVMITIGDVNEAPTVDDATFSIAENSIGSTVVGTVIATDPDTTAPNNTLSFAITGGNTNGAFAIDNSGQITVQNVAALDFETTPNFTLTITTTDGGALSDTATVTITITDVNETPTVNDATFSIDENSAASTLVGTVVATEPDTTAPNNTLSYAITAGNTGNAFAIDNQGMITVATPSTLDFETTPTFTLTVTTTDGGGLSDTATVTINLSDVNEAPTANDAAFTVPENSADNTVVGTVIATDPDTTAPNNTLTFAITSGNTGGAFAIDNSGKITVADSAVLDLETNPTFTLTVHVTDGGGLVDTANVTIDLSEINEAPTANDATFSVDENSASGTVVGTVVASDPDTTAPNNTLTFAITSGNTGNAFAIDNSGKVTVANTASLDFESNPIFNLTVTVTDGGDLSDTASVTVNLGDVNEAPTALDSGFSIAENSPAGTAVGTVSVTDPDTTSPNNSLTYAISSGNTGNTFAIDSAGKITVASPSTLNFETSPAFTLTVTVTDGGGLTDTATVIVNLTDVNEAPAVGDKTFTLTENTSVGTVVGFVTATDPDTSAPNNTLTYSITGGNTGNTFAIDTLGVITVTSTSGLDFEVTPTFTLSVTTTDGGGLNDTATVTINLTDVNEAPSLKNANFTVIENSPAGSVVGTVTATDPDATPPNNAITYAITGGNATNAFAIDAAGKITIATPGEFNFESTPPFSLTVTATDGGGLSAASTVTVNLLDVNEVPVANNATFTIPENSAIGTNVGVVLASDPDTSAPNNALTYSITDGNIGNAFSIDNSGQLTVADDTALDFEVRTNFTLTVAVTDGAGLSDTATVTVNLTNVNETPAATDDTATVDENGTVTIDVLANDSDLDNDPLTVSTVTQAANGVVTITDSGKSIQYSPNKGFDGSDTFSYTVSDGQGATATATVTIQVNNVQTPVPGEFAVGSDAGGNTVRFFNPNGTERYQITPFGPTFTGGIRVASADFNGDGVSDLVVGTGPGRSTQVKIFDGVTKAELFSVDPFEASFTGGVYVSVGDVNNDGVPDLAITPDEGGGPRVDIYSGAGFAKFVSFFGIDDPNFRGGARSSMSDMTGDGVDDLIVVAGFGGGPRVAGFDGTSLGGTPQRIFADFFAFEQTLRNGIFVASGDFNGDGFADLVAGGGPGGGPRVQIFDGKSLLENTYVPLANFFGGDSENRGGIRLAVKNLDNDNLADLIVGAGTGAGSNVTSYLGTNILLGGTPLAQLDFEAFDEFTGGVFVG